MSTLKSFFAIIQGKKEKPRYLWPLDKLVERNMDAYERNHGYRFDINNPKTFTEKLQWYKLFYENPNIKRIVDKYEFKKYIKEKIGEGHTIPVFGCWDNIEALSDAWDTLPDSFCLKSTISSEGGHILRIQDKSKIAFFSVKNELKTWFEPQNTMLNSYCTGYYDTQPRILAEEYVRDIGNILYDYKMFCFKGTPLFMYVAVEYKSGTDSPIVFYDLEWNKLDIQYGKHRNDTHVPKPKFFNDMVEIATQLSKDFPFVRVDFFHTERKLYLAELTFYPGGGFTEYHPHNINEKMGELFILPNSR